MIAAVMDSYAVVEQTVTNRLLPALQPGMLCLADRGFTSHPIMSAVAKTGADLLWRAKGNAVLPVLERYPDGSFRSVLVASTDKYGREDVLTVRVIQYGIDDPGRPGANDTTYRLLTTIQDPTAAPADELAALYAERWESSLSSTNSRPTNAAPEWCCAPGPTKASTKKPGATCACTTPYEP